MAEGAEVRSLTPLRWRRVLLLVDGRPVVVEVPELTTPPSTSAEVEAVEVARLPESRTAER